MAQKTKLGPHMQFDGFEGWRWLTAAPPAVAKFCTPKDGGFDAGARIAEIDRCSEFTLAIGHPMLSDKIILGTGLGEEYRAGYTPLQVATVYCNKFLLPLARAYPRIDFWEPYNEFEVDTDFPGFPLGDHGAEAQHRWYCEVCYETAKILWQQVGKRCALGAWSTGRPNSTDYPNWHLWVTPILRAVAEYGAIWSRHGYDPSPNDAGAGGDPTAGGSLRYRDDLARFAAMGYPDIRCVITECGWDWPPVHDRLGNIAEYVSRYCAKLEMALRADAHCLGATLYTHGTGGVSRNSFNTADPKNVFVDAWIAWANANAMPDVPPIKPGDGSASLAEDEYRIVNCKAVNVRAFPWLWEPTPPMVRTAPAGEIVRVYTILRYGTMMSGWALIDSSGGQWVNAYYLGK
jgi:hypothetical protein